MPTISHIAGMPTEEIVLIGAPAFLLILVPLREKFRQYERER